MAMLPDDFGSNHGQVRSHTKSEMIYNYLVGYTGDELKERIKGIEKDPIYNNEDILTALNRLYEGGYMTRGNELKTNRKFEDEGNE